MLKFLKQNFYRVLYSMAKVFWFLTRPKTQGVKCLIKYRETFLLVKFSYAHREWSLPGGGVKRGETPEQATCREIFEEAGIILDSLVKIGEFESRKDFKQDAVHCFFAEVTDSRIDLDKKELSEAGWFGRESLPVGCRPVVGYLFEMYDKYESI